MGPTQHAAWVHSPSRSRLLTDGGFGYCSYGRRKIKDPHAHRLERPLTTGEVYYLPSVPGEVASHEIWFISVV